MKHQEQALKAFFDYLVATAGISDTEWGGLQQVLKVVAIKRNDWLLSEGETCVHIDFIYTGAIRSFYNHDGTEITVGLHVPNRCVTQMKSLMNQEPSQINIQAVAPSVLVRLRKADMIRLYEQFPGMQGVGRKLLEHMLVEEHDWKDMHTLYNPDQRYAFLVQKSPVFIQVFPLQYIASFLGMRRETLSRIRSKQRM